MRSRTGCLTCRRRKLKCDEKKPICTHCMKAHRECIPSSGIVFRHQHNASMNGEDFGNEDNLKGFYAYKDTFDDSTVWVEVPKQVTFLNTTNPYTDPLPSEESILPCLDSSQSNPEPASYFPHFNPNEPVPTTEPAPELEPFPAFHDADLGPFLTSPSASIAPFDQEPILPPAPASTATSMSPIPPLPPSFISPLPSATPTFSPPCYSGLPSPTLGPIGTVPPATPFIQPILPLIPTSEPAAAQNQEIAFLLRHFSEGPGYWMSLFDLGKYFSSYIPVKARESPLIKYAALACSAKSLARIQEKTMIGGSATRQVCGETSQKAQAVNWDHKATKYYDTALSLLLQALRKDSVISPTPAPSPSWEHTSDSESPARKRRRTNSRSNFTEDMLAATAILGVYEIMSGSIPEWIGHIRGASSLLITLQQKAPKFQLPVRPTLGNTETPYVGIRFGSKAARATFWSIARQDLLAAFTNSTQTRIDTEDYDLCREAGLNVNNKGILPASATDPGSLEGMDTMKEDRICITLLWLLGRLVNFITSGDSVPNQLSQYTPLEYWKLLTEQIQAWHDSLPDSFQPSTRVDPSNALETPLQGDSEALFPEVWYSMPMCASAMQLYHMSQIFLYRYKPIDPSQGEIAPGSRWNIPQPGLAAAQAHAREIISISVACSDDAVRIQSLQPLFVAGQCLKNPRERQVVIKLLQGIESDLGWATDYRVKQLVEQWQLDDSTDVAMAGICADMVSDPRVDEIRHASGICA